MKLAMLGAAHVHASGYAQACKGLPDVAIAAVYDVDPQKAREIAALCGATAFDSAAACLGPEIDAVLICSENSRHGELVGAAAAAGKSVLCEKPLATTVAEAQALVQMCAKAGVQLMTAFPCRYHPTIERTRAHLEAGRLGEVLAVRATNHGQMPGGWFADPVLAGGGALMDHTVHVVDLLRYLLGAEFDSVYALSARRFHDVPTEDSGMLSMKMDSGVIVTLDPSWSRPASYPTWGNVTMELVGTEGSLAVDMFSQNVDVFNNVGKSFQWAAYGSDMNALMLADFTRRVQAGEAVAITGVDGLRATEVVAAAYASAASGGTEVVVRHAGA